MRRGFGLAIFLLLDIENLRSQGGKAPDVHVSRSSGAQVDAQGWDEDEARRDR